MWWLIQPALQWIYDQWVGLKDRFHEYGDWAGGIPVLSGSASIFYAVSDFFYAVAYNWLQMMFAVHDMIEPLEDIWGWSSLTAWVEDVFFNGKWVVLWLWDEVCSFLDIWLPWIWDAQYWVWEWVRDRVTELIPGGDLSPWGIWNSIYSWVYDLVSSMVPTVWSIWDTIYSWVVDEIVARVPSWDDVTLWVEEWLQDHLPDFSEIMIDPARWIADRLYDAMAIMLSVVGPPLLRLIANYLNRVWDVKEVET